MMKSDEGDVCVCVCVCVYNIIVHFGTRPARNGDGDTIM